MGETRLFLVRVWREGAQFRASVRAIDDDEPRLFTSPGPLGEFLLGAAGPIVPFVAPSPRPSTPTRSDP